jgi:hypothetical protein
MQICWRPLAPRETDHELVWLAVSLGGLVMAAIWLGLHLPWPRCAFAAVTGHPCLTCGASRSAIAFFHGQFPTAWRWNPLAFAGYCALSIFDAYAFAILVSGRGRRLRITLTTRDTMLLRAAVTSLLAVNWIYLVVSSRAL